MDMSLKHRGIILILIAYCNWTTPYTDATFVPTPDLATGTVPVGFVDGVCYLSHAANQCGLDLPHAPSYDLRPTATWTITIEKAVVYATFAQAYTPALPYTDASIASVGSDPEHHHSESHEFKPTCGISLAVVAKASLLDQQGEYSGTAHLTNELLWCPDVFRNTTTGLRASCLPSTTFEAPTPAPAAAPEPAPAPAPAPATADIEWAAPTPQYMATTSRAWQAKLAAVATQHVDTMCNNPGVAFANPGALKVTGLHCPQALRIRHTGLNMFASCAGAVIAAPQPPPGHEGPPTLNLVHSIRRR